MYVQDRIREGKTSVWNLLQAGAHVYVCGDAATMAGALFLTCSACGADITWGCQVSIMPCIWHLLPACGVKGCLNEESGPNRQRAGAVERALLDILAEKAPSTDAQQQLAKLTAEGRYQRDVWY